MHILLSLLILGLFAAGMFEPADGFAGVVCAMVWPLGRRKSSDADDSFRRLVEQAPEGIVIHDAESVLYANPAAAALVDADHEAVVGAPIDLFLAAESRQGAREARRRILDGAPGDFGVEYRLQKPDGTERVALISTVRHDHQGQTLLLSFLRDITGEVATRNELAVSRERLDLAMDASHDGVWDWDLRDDTMVYNDAWCRMLGLEPGEVSRDRSTWLSVVHPDDLPMVEQSLSDHLRGDTPMYEAELRLRHADGHDIWVRDRGRVVERDSDGVPARMAGTHHDISDARRAKELLALRQVLAETFLVEPRKQVLTQVIRLLSGALESPCGLVLWRDGEQPPRLEAVCEAPRGGPGLERLEIARIEGPLARVLAGESLIHEAEFVLPGLNRPLTRMVAVSFPAGPDAAGVIAVADRGRPYEKRDLDLLGDVAEYLAPIMHGHLTADLKERQLRQAQKMEALGALAGGIAHDFNNILQAVVGFTSLALEDAGPDGRVANDLQRVMRAATRGRDLVHRILQFSRREEQAHAPVDLAGVVREAAELLRATVRANITIKVTLPDEPRMVVGDPAQLSQAIMNLATNAVQAMGSDTGTLELSLRTARAGTEGLPPAGSGDEMMYAVEVADSGPGLTPEIRERAFDPFFTTKDVGQGTGLGLSVVHGIVTGHGGVVALKNRPDRGTSAVICLPPLEKAAPDARPAPLDILFIDDEEDIAVLGGYLLERDGHRVTTMTDPQAAWELVQRTPDRWHCVVSDISMPDLSGERLAARLLELRPELPVVLITGADDAAAPDPAAQPNVKGLIHKPFTRETLCSVMAGLGAATGGTADGQARD